MKCPRCSTILDDLLEFDAVKSLCCPTCEREFTPFEIWLMPLEDDESSESLFRMVHQFKAKQSQRPNYRNQVPLFV